MRFAASTIALSALALSLSCAHAFAIDERIDPQAMAALMIKADQAQPKEQCFLYAELVHQMTELAGQQYSSGDGDHASETLRLVQKYAEKIHMGVAGDGKKLKNAEELMRHTSFRLTGILNAASYDDRQALQATLKQLEQVQTELMMQGLQEIKTLKRTAAITSALLLLATGAAHAQSRKDPLTDRQIEEVREAGDEPLQRIRLFVGYVDDRAKDIHTVNADPIAQNKNVRLHNLMEEFTRLSDELQDNMDNFDQQHADLRKALKEIVDKTGEWGTILNEPKPNSQYDFSRKTAIDANQSAQQTATQMLADETKYFIEQKKKEKEQEKEEQKR